MAMPFVIGFKIFVIGLIIYLLSQAVSVFVPVLISLVLAFILYPLVKYLTEISFFKNSYRLNTSLAVLISFFIAAIILLLVIKALFTPLI